MKYKKITFVLLVSLLSFLSLKSQKQQVKREVTTNGFASLVENISRQDYPEFLLELQEKSKEAEENGDPTARIDVYNELTRVYIEMAEQGLTDIKNARFLSDVSKYYIRQSAYEAGGKLADLNHVQILNAEGRPEVAKNLLLQTYANFTVSDSLAQYYLDYVRAQFYHQQEDYNTALEITTNFDLNPISEKYPGLTAKINLLEADVLSKTGNLQTALRKANNTLKAIEAHKLDNLLPQTFELLAGINKEMGNNSVAVEYKKKAETELNTIILPEFTAKTETAARNTLDAYKDNYLILLQEDIRKNKEAASRNKLTSVLTSALFIIISLLAMSIYRNNQIKRKTNDLLLKKNTELQIAKEDAEQAMRAKAQFLATVSHELRTPLYAVTGLTHLLLEESPKESQKEHLTSLKFSGDYLLAFINDILQINKIEANKITPQKIKFSLNKVLTEVVSSLHQTAKENNNVIRLKLDDQIPKGLIGDPIKLSQIFINLVGNALKFTKDGEIFVVGKAIRKFSESTSVHFEVRDTGIGISQEVKDNIFESFAQGSLQINRKYGGTGLGLTIVKSLLSLFSSEIYLESEVGVGSTFYFDITFRNASEEKEKPVVQVQKFDETSLHGLHILLVEDNKINQVITRKMLERKQVTSDLAENGYQAIEKAKNNTYDAILMDIHMPGISGLKATKEIRKFNKKIPIIALTAISIDESTENFFEVGCTDIITKPFKPSVFYEKIGHSVSESIKV